MVRCSEIQNDLPLYSDGILGAGENAAVEQHLDRCPLCRQRLDELRRVQAALGAAAPIRMPEALLKALRSNFALELGGSTTSPQFRLVETRRDWISVWLMPFSVGGVATVVFVFLTLWLILGSVTPDLLAVQRRAAYSTEEKSNPVAGSNPTPGEYASSRTDISNESPSINPRGSLVELGRLMVSDGVREDEVVVVADVFENGTAEIAEVVEPPRNRRAVREIDRAFHSELAYAPFVPANLDQRSDRVRVVFKIQSVSVFAR